MNKSTIKGFISGSIFTTVLITIGIATVLAAGGIKSAVFNANKVIFNGTEINLASAPMVSIVKEGEENFSNYMPVRAVLEAMGYTVDWDGAKNAVIVNDKKGEDIQAQTPTIQPKTENNDKAKIINGYLTLESWDEFNGDVNNYYLDDFGGERLRSAYNDTNGQVSIGYNADDASFELFVEGKLLFKLPKDKIIIIALKSYIEKSYYDTTIQPIVDQYKIN